jgi:hypothetical protein
MVEPRKQILCIEDDRETAALIVEELADRGFEATGVVLRALCGVGDRCASGEIMC